MPSCLVFETWSLELLGPWNSELAAFGLWNLPLSRLTFLADCRKERYAVAGSSESPCAYIFRQPSDGDSRPAASIPSGIKSTSAGDQLLS